MHRQLAGVAHGRHQYVLALTLFVAYLLFDNMIIMFTSSWCDIVTFYVSCRRHEMYSGHVRLCVCPRPHTHPTAWTRM